MTFKNGNFDDFKKFIKEEVLGVLIKIQEEAIPLIDKVLFNMLKTLSRVEGSKITVNPIIKNNEIKGVSCELVYTVQDFIVPDVPKDAVDKDIKAIKEALNCSSVEINTEDGTLIIVYTYEF